MFKKALTLFVALALGGGIVALGLKQLKPKEIVPVAKNPEEFKRLIGEFNQGPSFDMPRAQLNTKALKGDERERDAQVKLERQKIMQRDKERFKQLVDQLAHPALGSQVPTENSEKKMEQ